MVRMKYVLILIVFSLIFSPRTFAFKLTISSSSINENSRAYIQLYGKDSIRIPAYDLFQFSGNTEPMNDVVFVDFEGDGKFYIFYLFLSDEDIGAKQEAGKEKM